jgi:hypothetical protein
MKALERIRYITKPYSLGNKHPTTDQIRFNYSPKLRENMSGLDTKRSGSPYIQHTNLWLYIHANPRSLPQWGAPWISHMGPCSLVVGPSSRDNFQIRRSPAAKCYLLLCMYNEILDGYCTNFDTDIASRVS